MPLRVLGGPLPTRKVRKLGAWTRPGNAWNGGESVGLIGGLIGGAGRRAERCPPGASAPCRWKFAFVYNRRTGRKRITSPPPFVARRYHTGWGRRTPQAQAA